MTLGAALTCWQCAAIGESVDEWISPVSDGWSQPVLWRLPENDGINCLYIQLRLLGYGGSYEMFCRQASDAGNLRTMESLAMLARRIGFHLTPMKLNASELTNMTGPVLVHMEEEGIGSGAFNLFLGATEQSVKLIEGSYMRWFQMPRDRFHRAWTGYVLIPQPTTDWRALAQRCGSVLLVGYLVSLLLDGHKPTGRLPSTGQL